MKNKTEANGEEVIPSKTRDVCLIMDKHRDFRSGRGKKES